MDQRRMTMRGKMHSLSAKNVFATIFMIVVSVSAATPCQGAKKEDPRLARVEKIKEDKRYYSGKGTGLTLADARRDAMLALSSSVYTAIAGSDKDEYTNINGNEDSKFESKTGFATFASLTDVEEIELSDEPDAEIFCYVLRRDVDDAMEERARSIAHMVENGIDLESRGDIASALKYFNWAMNLSLVHPKPIMIKVGDSGYTAREWLGAHIPVVLNNIKISLESVEKREGQNLIAPYDVTLNFTYNGDPVADLGFSYNNGMKTVRNNHVKHGTATLEYESLPKDEISLKVDYAFVEEGKMYDPALRALYESFKPYRFPQADQKIPVKGDNEKKFRLVEEKSKGKADAKGAESAAATASASFGAVAPATHRRTIEAETPEKSINDLVLKRVDAIEDAFRSGNFDKVKDFFTESGWRNLSMMRKSVEKIQVVKQQERKITVEQSPSFLVASGLLLKMKYKGGHTENENLVMRFTADGLCESLAYGLSERAREDIFRQNKWDLDARYAILKFMEDYQTAFAMKNIDFIRSLFSPDAVIITGKKRKGDATVKKDGGIFINDTGSATNFDYTTHTRDTYTEALKKDFKNNNYVHLTFEENEIASQAGEFANIYWIELKQYYNSQHYSDVGFLALQIDMGKADPTIYVRLWQPQWVAIDELKKRFQMTY